MEGVKIYLGLGSNLGDRMDNLLQGLRILGSRISLTRVSSIYESEPWGYTDQPAFLNCVCEGVTSQPSQQVLWILKDTESLVGRMPTFPGGPRVFDADLLFHAQLVVDEPDLQVPHPRLAERIFVLLPMAEIAPDFVHPLMSKDVRALLAEAKGREGVKWFAPPPTCALLPDEMRD